jgi:hypothetical protein
LLMLQVKSKSNGTNTNNDNKKHHHIMKPIKSIPIETFAELILSNCKTLNMI